MRSRALIGVACITAIGCGGSPPPPKAPLADPAAAFMNDLHPLQFRSARFELTVPLPDGHRWKIDDHRTPMLVATHAGTAATLTLGISVEPELMNRQRCEAAAHTRGLVHDDDFQTVDDEVIVGPGPYDTHISVAAVPGTVPHTAVSGHVLLFGAHMKKCLFVHYETLKREGEDESTLSARLAVARLQILGAIRVEAFDKPSLEHGR